VRLDRTQGEVAQVLSSLTLSDRPGEARH